MSSFQQNIKDLAARLLGPETPFKYEQWEHYRQVETRDALGSVMVSDPTAPLAVIDAHLSPLSARSTFELGGVQDEQFANLLLVGNVEVRKKDYFVLVGDGQRWYARGPGVNEENIDALTTVSVERRA